MKSMSIRQAVVDDQELFTVYMVNTTGNIKYRFPHVTHFRGADYWIKPLLETSSEPKRTCCVAAELLFD